MRDYYLFILATVCRNTGFTEHEVLHDKREMCTDARYLLIHFLSRQLKCNEIVYYSGISKQAVSQISNQYSMRLRFKSSMRWAEKDIEKDISDYAICPHYPQE